MQQRAPPPTHFVGLRCTSASVAAATGAHQARMLALNAAYEHTFCKPAEAHVTLCVLTLPDALSVDAAAAALRAVRWRALSPQLTGQLGRFGSRVLFLELSSDGERDQLCALQAAVVAALTAAGLSVSGVERFDPHITVAKARARSPRSCLTRGAGVSSDACAQLCSSAAARWPSRAAAAGGLGASAASADERQLMRHVRTEKRGWLLRSRRQLAAARVRSICPSLLLLLKEAAVLYVIDRGRTD